MRNAAFKTVSKGVRTFKDSSGAVKMKSSYEIYEIEAQQARSLDPESSFAETLVQP